jgi:hypothetical protein
MRMTTGGQRYISSPRMRSWYGAAFSRSFGRQCSSESFQNCMAKARQSPRCRSIFCISSMNPISQLNSSSRSVTTGQRSDGTAACAEHVNRPPSVLTDPRQGQPWAAQPVSLRSGSWAASCVRLRRDP